MAYDIYLAERIKTTLNQMNVSYEEKKMMGGLAIMVNDKMCVGVINNDLMARIGPEAYQEALKRHGAREMDFTKRPMKGWIYVAPDGIDRDEDLAFWVQLALDYNPKANSSKKKI